MKKVLIISHVVPRIHNLVKHLPDYDWQPISLEMPNPKEHLPTSRFLKLPKKTIRELSEYPDSEKGWEPYATKVGSDLIQSEGIEAIISSSSPVTSHIVANKLKQQHDIHWIADFRDLWTQNHNYLNSHRPYGRLRRLFEERLERRTLAVADALVTVSLPLAVKLSALHRDKQVHVVVNGFDAISNGSTLTEKFTITYTGQIYNRKQDPTKLLIALKDLIDNGVINPTVTEVRFFGPVNKRLQESIEKLGLSGIVKQYGVVTHETALQKQWESQVLLLLNWNDPCEQGVYTQKIFEYLAAQRPILAVGGFGNDVVEALLEETCSGVYCREAEDIENALAQMYVDFKSCGEVTYYGNRAEISKYSCCETARKFASILDGEQCLKTKLIVS